MPKDLPGDEVPTIPALIDLARNIAGTDETWLSRASESNLRATIREYRDQARAIINKANGE